MYLKINPTLVCKSGEVVFVDEFLGDLGQLNFDVLWSTKWVAKIIFSISKHTYFSPVLESILLIMILKSSSDAVLVPTPPG